MISCITGKYIDCYGYVYPSVSMCGVCVYLLMCVYVCI